MTFEPHQVVAFANLFGALSHDPEAHRSAHIQAGGFVWSDETPDFHTGETFPVPITRFMIALISYRNTLMRGTPHEPFTPYWDAFQKCCPTWPGFRSERCSPELIPDLDRELSSELDKLERMLRVRECSRGRKRLEPDQDVDSYLPEEANNNPLHWNRGPRRF
jgi:hypothetical protein